ncbi:MAG: hypothetical protein ACHQ4F_11870 [Candidatus Dormibacteria bacterium]
MGPIQGMSILDRCDGKRFVYWGNGRHHEAAMQQHRIATQRP